MDRLRKIAPVFTYTLVLVGGIYLTKGDKLLLGAADGNMIASSSGVVIEQIHPCSQLMAQSLMYNSLFNPSHTIAVGFREEAEMLVGEVASDHIDLENVQIFVAADPFSGLRREFINKMRAAEDVLGRIADMRTQAEIEPREFDPNNAVNQAVHLAIILAVTLQATAEMTPEQREFAQIYNDFIDWLRENPDHAELAYKKLAIVAALRLSMYADIRQEDCGPPVVGELTDLERAVHEMITNGVSLFNTPSDTPEEMGAENDLLTAAQRVLSELRLAKQAEDLAIQEEYQRQAEERRRQYEEERRLAEEQRAAEEAAAEAARREAEVQVTPTPILGDDYVPIPEPNEEYDAGGGMAVEPTPVPTEEYDEGPGMPYMPVQEASPEATAVPAAEPSATPTPRRGTTGTLSPFRFGGSSSASSAKKSTGSSILKKSPVATPTAKPVFKKLF